MNEPRARLRGLTLTLPWAWCVRDLGKDVENRDWPPPKGASYLAVHGGVLPPHGQSKAYLESQDDLAWVAQCIINGGHLDAPQRRALKRACVRMETGWQFGAEAGRISGIVALARIADVVPAGHPSPWAKQHSGYNWLLDDITPVPTLPYTGKQRLWAIDAPTTQALREAWEAVHIGQLAPF